MQAINRWRNWKPTDEKFGDSPEPELTKVPKPPSGISKLTFGTFGTSIPGQTQNFSDGIPIHDPAAWAEDFHRWALSNCRFKDRRFNEIGSLLADFGEWAVTHDSVPMTRITFEALLRQQGLFFADEFVYGLTLAAKLSPEEVHRLRPVGP